MSEWYDYNQAGDRTAREDRRVGVPQTIGPHEKFQYDTLHRLRTQLRGVSNGTGMASYFAGGSQQWDLTTLGNWKSWIVDSNGNGVFETTNAANLDAVDTRSHNYANEISVRTYAVGGVSTPINPTNDNNGNLLTKPRVSGTDNYVYDAWNRLVTHTLGAVNVSNFQYNGLHWRTLWSVTPAAAGAESRWLYYDASWRLVQEHVARNTASATVFSNYILQQFYGLRGGRDGDDALVRRVKMPSPASVALIPVTNSPWDFANFLNTDYYQLTDALGSVRATVKMGVGLPTPTTKWPVHEFVDYDAYGKSKHRYAADVDRNGLINAADEAAVQATVDTSGTANDRTLIYQANFNVG